jgi:hypothetical protein
MAKTHLPLSKAHGGGAQALTAELPPVAAVPARRRPNPRPRATHAHKTTRDKAYEMGGRTGYRDDVREAAHSMRRRCSRAPTPVKNLGDPKHDSAQAKP